MRTVLLILVFSFFQISLVLAGGINFSDLSIKKARDLAKKENKLVFIDAYTTWCGPCKMMDRETFKDPEVGAFFNEHFISVKMNMETPAGRSMPHAAAVKSYPAFLFLNPKGELVHQSGGFQPGFAFLNQGRLALKGAERFKMQDRYKEGERGIEFMFHYVTEQKSIVRPKKIEKLVRETLAEHQGNWENPYLIGLMFYLSDHPDTEVGKFLADNHEAAVGIAGWTTYMSNMQERFLRLAEVDVRKAKIKWPSKENMNQLYVEHISELAPRFASYYEMLLAMRDQDIDVLENIQENYLSKYDSDRAWDYKNFAEFLYVNSEGDAALEIARRNMLKAITLAPKSMDCYMTLSAIYDKMGMKDKAVKAKNRGQALAQEQGLEVRK